MSKSSLIDNLETIAVTSVITILVWLWAESQNVQSYASQRIQVRFVAPPGQAGQLAIAPSTPEPVDVSFTTSTGQYDRFRQEIHSRVVEIEVAVPSLSVDQIQSFALRNRLDDLVFRDLGITLDEVIPASLSVEVYPIETYRLPVRVEPPANVQLAANPVVSPSSVEIRLPVNLASRARGQEVVVSLSQADVRSASPNEPEVVIVPLTIPRNLQSEWSMLLTPQVEVTFTLRNQTESHVIGTTPIHINAPILLLERYRIDLTNNQFVRDVEVSGPANIIEQIATGKIKVIAEIRPTIEELEGGVTSLPVFFDLPEDVTVQSAVPQVSFTAERRD